MRLTVRQQFVILAFCAMVALVAGLYLMHHRTPKVVAEGPLLQAVFHPPTSDWQLVIGKPDGDFAAFRVPADGVSGELVPGGVYQITRTGGRLRLVLKARPPDDIEGRGDQEYRVLFAPPQDWRSAPISATSDLPDTVSGHFAALGLRFTEGEMWQPVPDDPDGAVTPPKLVHATGKGDRVDGALRSILRRELEAVVRLSNEPDREPPAINALKLALVDGTECLISDTICEGAYTDEKRTVACYLWATDGLHVLWWEGEESAWGRPLTTTYPTELSKVLESVMLAETFTYGFRDGLRVRLTIPAGSYWSGTGWLAEKDAMESFLDGSGLQIRSYDADHCDGFDVAYAMLEKADDSPIELASFLKYVASKQDQADASTWHKPPSLEQVGSRECVVTDASSAAGDRRRREVTWHWASGNQMLLVRWRGDKPVTGARQAALEGLSSSFEVTTGDSIKTQSPMSRERAGR